MDSPSLEVQTRPDGIVVARVAGAVELGSLEQLKERLEAAAASATAGAGGAAGGLVVELSGAPFVDSSGLGLFISLVRRRKDALRVRFCGLSPAVAAAFAYVGVKSPLEVDAGLEDSVAWLQRNLAKAAPAKDAGKPRLPLAAKYLLNEAGQRYCAQLRIPLADLRTQDGVRAVGFDWKTCNLELLRKLVIHGLVTTIEIARPEFVSARAELIEMVRTILDGMLIKRFRPELKLRLRNNPEAARIAGDPGFAALVGNRAAVASALKERATWAEALRASIEADCAARIRSASPSGSCDDEDSARVAALLDAIDDETALILVFGGPELVTTATEVVYSYARRMGIAEHLCLMLTEFVQVAEKSFFQNLAERDLYVRNHPEELERLLGEAEFRERLLKHAAQRDELMVLKLAFSGTVLDPAAPSVTEITVRNRGLVGYASRVDVMGRRVRMVKENSLEQILKQDAEGGGLGLIYHSLLEESCKAEGMGFSSNVVRDEQKDETVATLKLSL